MTQRTTPLTRAIRLVRFVTLFGAGIMLLAALGACGTTTDTTVSSSVATATAKPTLTPKPTQTPVSKGQASFPVCNAKVTNAPCVQYASIQDAAEGESKDGANVTTGMQGNIVWVHEDITNVGSSVFGPPTSLDQIQLQCYNVQQGLWYGLYSTINPGGSQTVRKSPFSEVDISFFDSHKGNAAFASCRLTSAGVDKIDKAGMWDDGDYTGAWPLYDSTTYR